MILKATPCGVHFQPYRADRCLDSCGGFYILVLQNNYTKAVHLFKVRDCPDGFFLNPLRYSFRFMLPECFDLGEYTYYVCSFDNWSRHNLDGNFIARSFIADHSVVSIGGFALLNNGKIVAHRDNSLIMEDEGCISFFNPPHEPEGDLYREIEVLSTGIVRLEAEIDTTLPEVPDNKTYVQYGG